MSAAFKPGLLRNVAAGTTSKEIALPAGFRNVTVDLMGVTANAFIQFGKNANIRAADPGADAAVEDSTRVAGGTIQCFTIPLGSTHISVKASEAATTVYLTFGNGE